MLKEGNKVDEERGWFEAAIYVPVLLFVGITEISTSTTCVGYLETLNSKGNQTFNFPKWYLFDILGTRVTRVFRFQLGRHVSEWLTVAGIF